MEKKGGGSAEKKEDQPTKERASRSAAIQFSFFRAIAKGRSLAK